MKAISKLLWPFVCLSLLSVFTACSNDRAENPVGVTASFSYSNGLITFVRDSDGGKEYLIYDGKYAYWVEDRLLPQS